MDPLSASDDRRYVIRHEIGRGGAATVYLADDTRTHQPVALKLLRRELVDSVGADRFHREIAIVAELRHPNIVPILDTGDIDRIPFYTMPYLDGGTLATRLAAEGALPLDFVATITTEVATALEVAHARGIVHRDIKPQNVLFHGGRAVIGDFGIARNISPSESESLTDSGILLGTPAYMSPEQCGGEHVIDARSDVYALGCVVYEMIAGEPPFTAPTAKAVIAKHMGEPVPQLRTVRPTVTGAIQAVIERALAKVPADRYATVSEFSRDLCAAVAGRLLSPATGVPIAARKRSKWLVPAAAVLAIVVTGLLGRAWVERRAASDFLDPHRIAVLYFDDLSPVTLPPSVPDGLTEGLIDQLSTVRALHVISPNGVHPYRGRPVRVDSLARTLSVGTIVGGSVQRSGDTVRVAVRLIAASTGQQLFSRTFTQAWSDGFALQDTVTKQVAFLLRQQLGEVIAIQERSNSTKSQPAWEAVQLASDLVRRATETNMIRNDPASAATLYLHADSTYSRASILDNAWSLPWLRRGRIAVALANLTGAAIPANAATPAASGRPPGPAQQRNDWLRAALSFADSALRRDARSAEMMALRGEALAQLASMSRAPDSLAAASETALRAAVGERPDFASAWASLAQLFIRAGRFGEAADAAQHAYDADAFFQVRDVAQTGFLSALYSERFDEAKSWCALGLDHYPGDPRFAECRLTLIGWTGHTKADVSDAWRELSAIERRDSVRTLAASWSYRRYMIAAAIARAGLKDSALRVVDRIRSAQQSDPTLSRGRLEEAYIQVLLDNRTSALDLLAEHLRMAPSARGFVARIPWYRPLRGDPRFDDLVKPAR